MCVSTNLRERNEAGEMADIYVQARKPMTSEMAENSAQAMKPMPSEKEQLHHQMSVLRTLSQGVQEGHCRQVHWPE